MEKNNNCLKEQHLSIFLEEHHFYLEQGLAERCVIIFFFQFKTKDLCLFVWRLSLV